MRATFEERVAEADAYAEEATTELAGLVTECAQAADALSGFTAGHELNIDRLALDGTKVELELWRSTRMADAKWRELLVRWRGHWRLVTRGRSAYTHLGPRGLDLYLWERPEDCDHEAVRLGVSYVQRDGMVELTPLHVDIVRVAQQDTPARLLGPTDTLEVIGQDGIVQEAHPLRGGTRYSGHDNIYRPDKPTWVPPKPEPISPSHHDYSPHEHAAYLNWTAATGARSEDGTISYSGPSNWPDRPAS